MSVIDLLSDTLPDTKTYHSREWKYVPGNDGTDDRDGTLWVWQTRGRARQEDRYGVKRLPGALVFLLVKESGKNVGEVYGVSLNHDHAISTCTCDAGNFKVGNCKHRDALKALVERGEFDETPGDADF